MSHSERRPIRRRDFISRTALAAGGVLSQPGLWGQDDAGDAPPNIVFIISDDQGWGDYGFMGHPHIRTPHIDRLAEQSVTFTRGYVSAPLCCPSLATMITGLHPHQSKRTCNDPPRLHGNRWSPERLALRRRMVEHVANAQTLPRLLASRGYLSMQTGKWWEGHYKQGGFTHGMSHGDPAKGGRHGDLGLKIGRDTMQPAFSFIDRALTERKPFFLWYAPMMPHSPHNPPERLFKRYVDLTPSPHVARYWAMCEWFDETCGQLLEYIDRKGIRGNTMVVYICDNGWIQREDSSRPAARSKMSSYEGGIRTPVMVRWPGHAQARRDERTLVSSIDLAPTVLAACGLLKPAGLQGVDLLDANALAGRDAVFGAGYGHDAVDVDDPVANLRVRWMLTGRWKLLLPFRSNFPGDIVELYDVLADPNETTNVAVENRDVVERMSRQIQGWWALEDALPLKFEDKPPDRIDVDFTADPLGWTRARDIRNLSMTPDGFVVEASGNDPILVISPCHIDPDLIKRVRVRLAATAGTKVEFRWGTESFARIDPGKELSLPLIADGKVHEYVFEVGAHAQWRGAVIKRLRFDPGDAQGVFTLVSMRGEP